MGEPILPPSRCPHNVNAPERREGGWATPYAPESCTLCTQRGWEGVPYRIPEDEEEEPEPERVPVLMECPEPGCCLVIEQGSPHAPPCLDPDLLAKIPSDSEKGPLWVLLGRGMVLHGIDKLEPWTMIVTTLCGRRGEKNGLPIKHSDPHRSSRCSLCVAALYREKT